MDYLKKIFENKVLEVQQAKQTEPLSFLRDQELYQAQRAKLQAEKPLIIAEFKRASPSKGIINDQADLAETIKAYEHAGVQLASVLTDQNFFSGNLADLKQARQNSQMQLLRKDFMLDAYQLEQSKAYGADFILLIACMLDKVLLEDLAAQAQELDLQVLLEIHELQELDGLDLSNMDLLGVNNRNLRTFATDLENSVSVCNALPDTHPKIAESGVDSLEAAQSLLKAGFYGLLIGEFFMKNLQQVPEFMSSVKAKS